MNQSEPMMHTFNGKDISGGGDKPTPTYNKFANVGVLVAEGDKFSEDERFQRNFGKIHQIH